MPVLCVTLAVTFHKLAPRAWSGAELSACGNPGAADSAVDSAHVAAAAGVATLLSLSYSDVLTASCTHQLDGGGGAMYHAGCDLLLASTACAWPGAELGHVWRSHVLHAQLLTQHMWLLRLSCSTIDTLMCVLPAALSGFNPAAVLVLCIVWAVPFASATRVWSGT
jgi:hypothetical protein